MTYSTSTPLDHPTVDLHAARTTHSFDSLVRPSLMALSPFLHIFL